MEEGLWGKAYDVWFMPGPDPRRRRLGEGRRVGGGRGGSIVDGDVSGSLEILRWFIPGPDPAPGETGEGTGEGGG